MEYKINPVVFGNVATIPASIIDENLKLASVIQLKTILWFVRHSMLGETVTVDDIASATGYAREDCEDAMIFWAERGVIIQNGIAVSNPVSNLIDTPNVKKSEPVKKTHESIPIVKPTYEEVTKRFSTDEEMKLLGNEAQKISSTLIGYSFQSTLIMIRDSYGLPPEVILMLLQFCTKSNLLATKQISHLAQIWADEGINTIELADDYIKGSTRFSKLWQQFRNLSGVKNEQPTTNQQKYFKKWTDEYGFGIDLIFAAYERSIEQTGKFSLPYADKVLKNWFSSGIKTSDELEKATEAWEAEKKKNKKSGGSGLSDGSNGTPSYNTDKFGKLGLEV